MFKLKVVEWAKTGFIMSDSVSDHGGLDINQIDAFTHLFPEGFANTLNKERLFHLAHLHGWTVEIRREEES